MSGFGRICNFGRGRLRSVEKAEALMHGRRAIRNGDSFGGNYDKSALRNMYAQVYLSKVPSGFGLSGG